MSAVDEFYTAIIAALLNTLDALNDANSLDADVIRELQLARGHLDAALAKLAPHSASPRISS